MKFFPFGLIFGLLVSLSLLFFIVLTQPAKEPCVSHQEQYSVYNAVTGEFRATTDTTYTGDCVIGGMD